MTSHVMKKLLEWGTPVLAFALFLGLWSQVASRVHVSFGALPGPKEVWVEGSHLVDGYLQEQHKKKDFYLKQSLKKEDFLKLNPGKAQEWRERKYSGSATYFDQIFTSLKTVFTGFILASLVAVPLGILCGWNEHFFRAMNPFIQIFKPVSPLAWLPIVMILVSALYNPKNPWFEKSFITSAVTVALCSLWPTLINTAIGVASIEKDYLNVAKVLKLGRWSQTVHIVIPSALPYIFTGLRLSLGVGWMVLIAAEMLAQNPGLGKFIWDMFQNGSRETLSQIMVAVFTIGFIGFLLDRTMTLLQSFVSWNKSAVNR